jgi:single-strand DNA-binding protein
MPTATKTKTTDTTEAAEPERTVDAKGQVSKVGNMTKEPELRFGQDKGTPFCRFGLATETPKVPGQWSGERVTEFYDVTCFGSLAEHVAELDKGTRVLVIGRGEVEHWTDNDGNERMSKRIVADACGPDLRWATADVQKVKPKRSTEPAPTADGFDEKPF